MINVERLMKKLTDMVENTTLANTDEDQLFALESDPDIPKIWERGQFVGECDGESYVCDHPDGTCHQAVCHEFLNNKQTGDKIYTGMACQFGKWYRHSWIVNAENQIVEPCSEVASDYFGFELTEVEQAEFLDYWAGRKPVWAKTDKDLEGIEYLLSPSCLAPAMQ